MRSLLSEIKNIFNLKFVKKNRKNLFTIIISSIPIFNTSCYSILANIGTHCINYDKTYTRISGVSWSPDNHNFYFVYTNSSLENNQSFLNTYLYTMGDDGKNLKKIALIQKILIGRKIDINLLINTKYLSDNSIVLCDSKEKLIKINNSGNKTVAGDCNKIYDFLRKEPDSYNIAKHEKLNYLSKDGNYLLKNNSVLVLSSSEVKILEIDKEYLNEFPDNKRITIKPIKGSENKVFVSVSYKSNIDDTDFKMDFSIGEIDYKDFTIKNLKSFKKSTPYDSSINVLAEKDEKIIYEKNDKFYIFDYKIKNEEMLKFTDNLTADKTYLLTYFDSYFYISPDMENMIFMDIDNDYFNISKIGTNNNDKKVILTQENLPIGDKVKYTECSTTTL